MTSPPAEQQALIEHPLGRHGVVLAGPGTGKSTTVLRLVARLAEEKPDAKVKVITFTRAATAELVAKIREEGHGLVEPSTVPSRRNRPDQGLSRKGSTTGTG